jgi:hypothetical protein
VLARIVQEGVHFGGEGGEAAHGVDGIGLAVVAVAVASDGAELLEGVAGSSAVMYSVRIRPEDEHFVWRQALDTAAC